MMSWRLLQTVSAWLILHDLIMSIGLLRFASVFPPMLLLFVYVWLAMAFAWWLFSNIIVWQTSVGFQLFLVWLINDFCTISVEFMNEFCVMSVWLLLSSQWVAPVLLRCSFVFVCVSYGCPWLDSLCFCFALPLMCQWLAHRLARGGQRIQNTWFEFRTVV